MAILFSCPSCRQPIEVDDAWGGSSVACPYCRKVVAAPRESEWPKADIPVASPAQELSLPPSSSPGYRGLGAPQDASAKESNSATWALLLAFAGVILTGLGFLIWMFMVSQLALNKTGPNPTHEQLSQALNEILIARSAPLNPAAVTALLVGVFCGLSGLVLSVRSLVRKERHTIKAVVASLLAGISVFCQMLLMLTMAGSQLGPPT